MTIARRTQRARLLLQLTGVGAAVIVIWLGFRDVDFAEVAALITALGPAALLVLLPYLGSVSLDTCGWKRILRALGHRLPFPRLLAVRLSTEAVLMSAPGGNLLSDTVKPFLLRALDRVPIPVTLASVTLRKLLLVLAEAIFLGLGLVLGFDVYRSASEHFVKTGWLPWMVGGVALSMLLAVAFAAGLLRHGRLSERVYRLLVHIGPAPARRWLEQRRQGFTSLDVHLQGALAGGRAWVAVSTSGFLGMWLTEAFETYLIANLLGVPFSFFQALAVEAMCSLIRALVFFVPAGLGFQDLSYTAFFAAFGVVHPASTGASFALLKRAKELIWVVLGYVVLAALPIRARQTLKELRSGTSEQSKTPSTSQRQLCATK
jgi:hypothetical protein